MVLQFDVPSTWFCPDKLSGNFISVGYLFFRVVFGYEGKTFTLQVVAEGNRLLILFSTSLGRDKNQMFDTFSSAAVMYGYARVNKPNALPSEPAKFVFIYWVSCSLSDTG